MAVLVGMRNGLHVALTRHACAGPPSPELAAAQAATRRIEAMVLHACTMRPATYGDVLRALAAGYGDDRWREHWQGGPIGYRQREFEIAPEPADTRWHREPVAPHHAVAFNPSVAGGGKVRGHVPARRRRARSPSRPAAPGRPCTSPAARAPRSWRWTDDRSRQRARAALGALVRRARSAGLPPPRVGEGDRLLARRAGRPAGDRHLQPVERGRQLQRPLPRPGRGGAAGRARGRRAAARVPGLVARREPPEADHDAVPEPDGDGCRGGDPLLPVRRRRADRRLRQDAARAADGRRQRRRAGDHAHRRHRRGGAVPRPGAVGRHRPLALHRRAARRADHARRLRRARGGLDPRRRALQRDGHRLDDGVA